MTDGKIIQLCEYIKTRNRYRVESQEAAWRDFSDHL